MVDRRSDILKAAMSIADEQGLDAVSMRAVARRIGVTPMALYPYVGNKAELLDGLVGLLLAEMPPAAPGTGWRERLETSAVGIRDVAHRHPAAFGLLLSRPAVTADATRALDGIYAALLDAGVPPAEIPRVERLLSTFVLGYAVGEVAGRFGPGSLSPRARRAQLPTAELPAHQRLAEHLDVAPDWSAEFHRDLDDLLALVEHIAATASGSS